MASIENPQKLINLEKRDPDLHIGDHKSPGSIVVTHQKRRVAVYQVQDLKTSKVWSTKTGQQIVNKTVYDPVNEQYAVLLSNKLMWQWKDDHASIEKGRKVKLDREAWSLLEGGPHGSFIVYKDGSVARLADLETATESRKESVQFCLSALHQSNYYVAVITDNLHVYINKYSSPESTPTTLQFKLPKESVISKSTVCFHKQGPSLLLLVLGSDGSLRGLNVLDRLSEWKTLPFPETKSPCLSSLGSNSIAIGGLVSNDQAGLGIWDIKYGLLQTFSPLPDSHSQCQELYAIGPRLVIVCGTNIYVCRYSVESTSLAAALGRRLKDDVSSSSMKRTGSDNQGKLKQLLLTLADKQKNIKPSEMETGLKNASEMLAKLKNPEFLEVMSLVCQVISRCADNNQLWLPKSLLQIIKGQPLPARLCENVVEKALKKEDISFVFNFARHTENVPEHILVKCLNFLLKCDDNLFTNATKDFPLSKRIKEDAPIECPFGGVKASAINHLLKLPYNDVFLQDCMKDMEFTAAMPLLQYLCYILTCSSLLATDVGLGITLLQATDWLNITVDAHFAQLVLSVEARKLLVDLHQTVESQVNLLEELVSLEGILDQIKTKGGIPYREPPGIYNIHTLHIV